MIRTTQPPINAPSVARAVQHALVAGLAVIYIGTAAWQITRDNVTYVVADLLIAALLGLILSLVSRRHGRVLANYGTRLIIKSAGQERWCAWCGESIPTGSRKVAHKGACEGKPFTYHHHVECDAAGAAWVGEQRTKHLIAHPEPGTMERGRPQTRGIAENR